MQRERRSQSRAGCHGRRRHDRRLAALDGQTDPIIQTNLIEDAINNGANFVILLPAEAEGTHLWFPAVRKPVSRLSSSTP
jgi:hypothetical protein